MKTEWYNCILEDKYGRDDIKAVKVDGKYYDEHGQRINVTISSYRERELESDYDFMDEYCEGGNNGLLILAILIGVASLIGWLY